ncbi:PD-(D/E)XK motif protein [Mesorhizobium sp. NZP2298]|uniref:PD-(D/E)XK motif protein n=1 Tax=Mesorhizobium sp. NZP2298 TaxID=2483403 RepID=UPI001556B104|nr:PD-(D/E)XK motif protein [Mesorhizobium sp. NZP2298]QKC97165.1 PD-(D/E)XK motif protein [Mesorhizobium sp. NZP2298]
MTATFIDIWRSLRASRPAGEDQIQSIAIVYNDVETPLRLAMDASGDLHLLAPTSGLATRPLPPDYNGLRLREGLLDVGVCLDLCSPAAHEKMFAALCGELVEAIIVHGREPWSAAIAIVRAWQSAWRPLRQPMSRPVQIGLVGELLVMQTLWLPALGSEAIHLWSGPDRERHDFVSPRLHMEVKATTKSRHEHEISRVDQLKAPDDRRLLLASIQLEESAMGTQSVATLIDGVMAAIRQDPAAVDSFLTKLDGFDWSDEMRRSPDLVRFHLRDAHIFEVDEEFPQLPIDFALPNGVLSIRYTISLANLPYLDAEAVRDDIAEAMAA